MLANFLYHPINLQRLLLCNHGALVLYAGDQIRRLLVDNIRFGYIQQPSFSPWTKELSFVHGPCFLRTVRKAGSLKMDTALEYSTVDVMRKLLDIFLLHTNYKISGLHKLIKVHIRKNG